MYINDAVGIVSDEFIADDLHIASKDDKVDAQRGQNSVPCFLGRLVMRSDRKVVIRDGLALHHAFEIEMIADYGDDTTREFPDRPAMQ